ncbi:MAG: leucine-rich repeat domain-containing protein [Eubacteriales bacterium]|jgi:hypothetical protein
MKKILPVITLFILAMTLLLALASCDKGSKDTPSLISTSPQETTTPAPETTTEPSHEHSYTEVVTPPTCTEGGYTTYTCSCGDTYVDNQTDPLGHDWGEWKTTVAATCTAVGTETRSCTRCDATETREIPKAAHNYVATVIPPGKTTQGYTKHVCSVCGDSYNDNYTNPTGSVGLDFTVNPDDTITITGIGTCTDEDIIIYSTYYVDEQGNSKVVSSIAANAFRDNTTIKTISIPASVTSIGDGAFAGCTKLTEFKVESENKNFSTVGGVLMSKDGSTIVAYPAGLNLTTYTVSASITTIRPSAFAGCANLTVFEVASGNARFTTVDGVLYDSDKITLIAYPAGKASTSFTLPDTVEKIGDYAFYKATKLSAITLNDRTYESDGTTVDVPGISSIGSYAFYGCTGLTKITIPNITTAVNTYAFANCTKLAEVNIGSGLKTISTHCFEGCTAIKYLLIPETVEVIDDYAFYDCTNLTTLVLRSGVKEIGYRAFTNCLNKGTDSTGKNIARVYYEGTASKWNSSEITIDASNWMYLTMYADLYFYSETDPGSGNYWRFVDGVATPYR